MKRNPAATCGTCPYWHQNPKSTCGKCQTVSWTFLEKLDTEWCGQHPDFWEDSAGTPTWKCECCGGTFPTPITGNDLIDADLAKATIDDLYTEIAQRDAVIAQCAAALDALCKEDVRGRDLITLETWSALMHARDATRAITPAPLYVHAKELLLAAWAVYDASKTTEKLTELRIAIGKCEGELD